MLVPVQSHGSVTGLLELQAAALTYFQLLHGCLSRLGGSGRANISVIVVLKHSCDVHRPQAADGCPGTSWNVHTRACMQGPKYRSKQERSHGPPGGDSGAAHDGYVSHVSTKVCVLTSGH